jgi:hypothetical protein
MWRSRARLGLGAIVVALALAWPAAAVAGVAQPDASTLQVSPATVQASVQTPLTLSFTTPASQSAAAEDVTLAMPPGWTAIPPSSSDLACPNSACSLQGASSTQFEVEVSLKVPTTLTLSVQATPPGFATSSTFTAVEQPLGIFAFAPTPVTVSAPPVTVTCPAAGLGTMQVDPASVPATTSRSFTFTYTAGSCGAGPGGVVTVTVPPGWTSPSVSTGTPGFVTWTGPSPLSVSGSTIVVPVGNLETGTVVTFEYDAAQDPASVGAYTFAAGQDAAGEPSQPLASPPTVTVTPVGPASTSPSAGGGGGATTSPPGNSTAPSSGQGTATPTGTAHLPIDWRPILLVVIALILVAGMAGLAAVRPPGRGGRGTAGGNVRAVPRTGPPPSVAVRDTGDRPALTVRIEPRAGATVTTIEERQP